MGIGIGDGNGQRLVIRVQHDIGRRLGADLGVTLGDDIAAGNLGDRLGRQRGRQVRIVERVEQIGNVLIDAVDRVAQQRIDRGDPGPAEHVGDIVVYHAVGGIDVVLVDPRAQRDVAAPEDRLNNGDPRCSGRQRRGGEIDGVQHMGVQQDLAAGKAGIGKSQQLCPGLHLDHRRLERQRPGVPGGTRGQMIRCAARCAGRNGHPLADDDPFRRRKVVLRTVGKHIRGHDHLGRIDQDRAPVAHLRPGPQLAHQVDGLDPGKLDEAAGPLAERHRRDHRPLTQAGRVPGKDHDFAAIAVLQPLGADDGTPVQRDVSARANVDAAAILAPASSDRGPVAKVHRPLRKQRDLAHVDGGIHQPGPVAGLDLARNGDVAAGPQTHALVRRDPTGHVHAALTQPRGAIDKALHRIAVDSAVGVDHAVGKPLGRGRQADTPGQHLAIGPDGEPIRAGDIKLTADLAVLHAVQRSVDDHTATAGDDVHRSAGALRGMDIGDRPGPHIQVKQAVDAKPLRLCRGPDIGDPPAGGHRRGGSPVRTNALRRGLKGGRYRQHRRPHDRRAHPQRLAIGFEIKRKKRVKPIISGHATALSAIHRS
ncbi:hypothetical protein NBRC116599_28340 [Aquicoccus sp. SU-CL01552]